MKVKNWYICFFTVFIIISYLGKNQMIVHAQEFTDKTDSMLDEMDFDELNQILEEKNITSGFDFKSLIKKLISGEEINKKELMTDIKKIVFQELNQSKYYLAQIVLLVVAFAILYNFSNVFEKTAITDISFYMVYMILLVLLMKSFLLMSNILTEAIGSMLEFMQALVPAFCLSMMFSTGAATTYGFYQIVIFLIYVIQWVMLYGVVPAIHIYIILELLNHLTKEELISKMTELIKTGVEWVLKALFTVVIGINVIQGLLHPVIDGFKSTLFSKTASMIPGVGNSIGGIAEILVGSGIVIKNGIGLAGIIILILFCAGPMIEIGILTIVYKVSAAVVQPVADKRLSGCISGMGVGAALLGKVLITANAMLLVTIALVTASTTWHR